MTEPAAADAVASAGAAQHRIVRRAVPLDHQVQRILLNAARPIRRPKRGAQGRLIVRHLLLPGHLDCCYRPIVRWMKAHLPGVKFSVRDGYLPSWQARHYPELARPLDRRDGRAALSLATRVGLNVIY